MKKVMRNTSTRKQLAYLVLDTFAILTLPLIAMGLNDTANWSVEDFFAAALLLFGSGLVYILISQRLRSRTSRLIVGITILIILAVIWAELAVGIFS